MHAPSVLDHLVPAFGADVYGASLDELPLNVWMKSTIRPMKFDRLGLGPPVWHYVNSDPEALRYRVVMFDGERRVEFGEIKTQRGRRFLSVGWVMMNNGESMNHMLPKTQHAAFSRTATVDPNPDYEVSAMSIGPVVQSRSILTNPSFRVAAIASAAYLLYRASTRRSSRGE